MVLINKYLAIATIVCGFTLTSLAQQFNNLEITDKMSSTGSSSSSSGSSSPSNSKTKQCREGCLEKKRNCCNKKTYYSIKEILCSQQRECSMCWDKCTSNHKIRINTDSSHKLSLNLIKMIRNESLVTADVTWSTIVNPFEPPSQSNGAVPSTLAATENVDKLSKIATEQSQTPTISTTIKTSKIMQALSQQSSLLSSQSQSITAKTATTTTTTENNQCLVTWEVSGGGLMGNLLTESSNVQLSLWPETNYRVQVTCRNKDTDTLDRSLPLTLDTSNAIIVSLRRTTTQSPPPTPTPTLVINEEFETDIASSSSEDELTDEFELTNENVIEGSSDKHVQPTLSIWPIYNSQFNSSQNEIIILGLFVAILVFLLIVLTIVIFIKRKNYQTNEKELLINNEILPEILHV